MTVDDVINEIKKRINNHTEQIAKKNRFLAYRFIDKPSEFKLLTYKSKKRLYFMEMQICEEIKYKELIGAKYNEEI